MNILVTGGLGLIGSNLVKELKQLNHNVITVDLKPEADYVLDISKDDLTQIKENIDVVFDFLIKGEYCETQKQIIKNYFAKIKLVEHESI